MSRTIRTPRRQTDRCRPRLERLESRLALSASADIAGLSSFAADLAPSVGTPAPEANVPYLAPVASTPAEGASLATPPSSVTVTFNRPIAPYSLNSGVIEIQRNSGDSWVNAFSYSKALVQSLDSTGLKLTLNFPQALTPGTFRIVLSGSSRLAGTDLSTLADPGPDRVLATFSVVQPVSILDTASALNVPVSTPVSVSGSLDLTTNPGAADLYTFTLPVGHHWRVGAEVFAKRIGSPARTTVSLFDATGRVIETANEGRPDAPADPYLFAGLAPGTYYLGVSAHDNVPGGPGGYDPSTGGTATHLGAEAGGAYQLNVVADPADAPVRLLGSSLQYADPTDPHPTGFALAFSGLLDTAPLYGNDTAGVQVVNQDGRKFAVTAVGQSESSAQYDFLFDQDLPAGHYSILVPDQACGGVTDLAGLTPVAQGQPAGVLRTFDVGGASDPDPKNLGPLYLDIHDGVTRRDVVAPGSGATYRFVVTVEDHYQLDTTARGGAISVRATGAGQGGAFLPVRPGVSNSRDLYLEPGVYYLQFVNSGANPVHMSWTLKEKAASWESLLANGVGQGPGLNLRLVSLASTNLTDPPAPGTESPAQTTAPAAAGAPTPGRGSYPTSAPAGLFFTVGGSLAGRPSAPADHVAAVGPVAGSGSTALASSAPGLPPGIVHAKPSPRLSPDAGVVGPDATSGRPEKDLEPVNGALVAEAAPAADAVTDETVIASADWLTDAGNAAARWTGLIPQEAPAADSPETTPAAIALARDDTPAPQAEESVVERAQMDAPLIVGVATVLSFRFHHPFLRWLKRTRSGPDSKRTSGLRTAARGPHARI